MHAELAGRRWSTGVIAGIPSIPVLTSFGVGGGCMPTCRWYLNVGAELDQKRYCLPNPAYKKIAQKRLGRSRTRRHGVTQITGISGAKVDGDQARALGARNHYGMSGQRDHRAFDALGAERH